MNVRRTKVIAESKIKTDALDDKNIAQCLRTGFVATAYIPSKQIMKQRGLLRHRQVIRKELTWYKNKIPAILLMNGIHHPFTDVFGVGGMRFLKTVKLPDSPRYTLNSYLHIVETLTSEKTQITKKIKTLSKHNQQTILLTRIPGVS